MSWQSHRTAPQTGWFLVTNRAMAPNGHVEIAKRDRRRKGQYFVRRCGSLIFVDMWAPIPDLPVFSKTIRAAERTEIPSQPQGANEQTP